MRKTFLTLTSVVALGLISSLSIANAQQRAAFDANKFFEEIASRASSVPAGFDAKKFFDDIASRAATSRKNFSAKEFFEELDSRGVKMKAGFDGHKFFEEIASRPTSAMPPMVDMKMK